MRKKKRKLPEPGIESPAINPESSMEYDKYIKKLDLQRSVLTKIVNSDLNQIALSSPLVPDNPDSI